MFKYAIVMLVAYALVAICGCTHASDGVGKPDGIDRKPPRVAFDVECDGRAWGVIVLELDPGKAPITAANFLRYVDEGYFNGTLIHRVTMGPRIKVFQGGGYTALNSPNKPGQHGPIKLESNNGLKNTRGTIAMARDAAPDTATSEFFVNIEANPRLDYTGPDHAGYCVFGQIVEGLDVMDHIAVIETRTNPDPELKGEKSQPIHPPVVRTARRVK